MYERFSLAVSVRMRAVARQDQAYTIEVVHAMMDMWEQDFIMLCYNMPPNKMEACLFFLITCTGGYQGFETIWMNIGALLYDLENCEEREDYSAVLWPMVRCNPGCGATTTSQELELWHQDSKCSSGHSVPI